ncbi:MAG: hypothetical protein ACFB9M_18560 [Myxococcota bacterium]
MKSLLSIIWLGLLLALAISAGFGAYAKLGGWRGWASAPSSGPAGRIQAYGQTSEGPVPLPLGAWTVLPRPQNLVFSLHGSGYGPRDVQIWVENDHERVHAHDLRVQGSRDPQFIDAVLRLNDRTPDRVKVGVELDAPHRPRNEFWFGIIFKGASSSRTR